MNRALNEIDDPARAIVKLTLTGTLTLKQQADLDACLEHYGDILAALEQPERHRHIVIRPDDDDFSSLELTGYVADARDRLQERAHHGPTSDEAADALSLLLRLSAESS